MIFGAIAGMAIARCCTDNAYFFVPSSSTCFRVNHVNSPIFAGVNSCWFFCGIFYVVSVLLVLNRQVRPCCHRHGNQESWNNRKSLFHCFESSLGNLIDFLSNLVMRGVPWPSRGVPRSQPHHWCANCSPQWRQSSRCNLPGPKQSQPVLRKASNRTWDPEKPTSMKPSPEPWKKKY